jgi:hypothetical protein
MCIDVFLLLETHRFTWRVVNISANIRRIEDISHILFEVFLGIRMNSTTQNEYFELIGRMSVHLVRLDSGKHLLDTIKAGLIGSEDTWLSEQIGTWLPWLIGTIVTIPLTRELLPVGIGRKKDSDD